MDKHSAIELLGGTPSAAAEEIGISSAAVSQWPEVLPPRIADRVQAALWRRLQRAQATADQAQVAQPPAAPSL